MFSVTYLTLMDKMPVEIRNVFSLENLKFIPRVRTHPFKIAFTNN